MTRAVPKRARPRKTPAQARSREMFESILEAAARVFVKEGYAHATTNRIAHAAGISVGSLYQYFPSKDAIAVELLRRYRDALVELVGKSLARIDAHNVEEVIGALVTSLLRAEGINPTLHRALIEQVLRTDARAAVMGFEERLEELVASALRGSGAKFGVRDLDLAAFVLVRVVLAMVHAAVVDRPAYNTPELAKDVTRLVVRYLSA